MVNDDRALVTTRRVTHAAMIAVAFQHLLPQATKVFLVLPPERVADSTSRARESSPSRTGNTSRAVLLSPSHHPFGLFQDCDIDQPAMNRQHPGPFAR